MVLENLSRQIVPDVGALLLNKDDFVEISGCEFSQNLITEPVLEAGHASDNNYRSQSATMGVGQLVVLIQRADWSNVLEFKGIVFYVLELGVVFELHPACVRLCDINRFEAHILKVKNHRFNDYTRWLPCVASLLQALRQALQTLVVCEQ